ncbi:MAG: tripartite tricarboxylate transporter substrate-binding protein, partial [Beijerinckiaceae bacterium]
SNIDLGIGKPGAKLSIEDARSREIKTASTGGASPAVLLPTALNTYAGTKFRLILGYRGIADSLLAVERGETDIAGAGGLASTLARHPSWIEKREAPILYQAALERHPAIPHVPTIVELANGDTGKAVMRALASTAVIGRSLISTPGVPAERIAILRKAFDAMVKDSAYLEAAKKRKVMLDPATGAQMDKVAQDTLAMPKDIAAKVAALLQPPKKK